MIYVQRLYHNLKCYHIGGQKVAGTESERYYYSKGHGCSCSKMPKTSIYESAMESQAHAANCQIK